MDIFKLVGSIFVDNTEANNSLQKTDDKALKVGETLTSVAGTAAAWAAAFTAAAAACATAIYEVATETAETADNIDKMSQKLGLSREAYQEWEYVLSQSGVEIDSLASGMKTLANYVAGAIAGTEEAVAAFDAVGLSVEQLAEMSTEDIFASVVTSMQSMEDNAERAALANDLLGRSGQSMAALFNSTSESTEALIERAHELGMVLSDDVIDSGVTLTDTMDTLERSFSAVGANVGAAFMPLITELADTIIGFVPTINEFVSTLLPGITAGIDMMVPVFTEIIEQIIPVLMTTAEALAPVLLDLVSAILPIMLDLVVALLPSIITLVTELMPVIVELMTLLLPVVVELIAAVLPPLVEIIVALLPLLYTAIDLIEPIIGLISDIIPMLADLVNGLVPVVGMMVTVVNAIMELFLPAFQAIRNILNPIFKWITDMFKMTFDGIIAQFNNIVSFIKNLASGNFKAALGNIRDIAKEVLNEIIGIFKATVNAVAGVWNGIANTYNNMQLPAWLEDLIGHPVSFSLPTIPALAKGGKVTESGVTLVGENGPELLTLPGASQVTPLRPSDSPFKPVQTDEGTNERLDELIALMGVLTRQMSNQKIYLDGKTLVGGITDQMDKSLAGLSDKKVRYA